MRIFAAIMVLFGSALCCFGVTLCDEQQVGSNVAEAQNTPWNVTGISGSVDDGDKRMLPGVCVRLFTTDGKRFVARVKTNGKGEYRFNSISPGHYLMVVDCDRFCAASFAVHVSRSGSQKSIVVHMAPDGLDSCSISELK